MIDKKNIFDNIETNSQVEIFDELIKNEYIRIERIITYPNSIPENQWFDQENNEWVILLKGSATIEFENDILVYLQTGDYVQIHSHIKHKVKEVDKIVTTVWLAIHYK